MLLTSLHRRNKGDQSSHKKLDKTVEHRLSSTTIQFVNWQTHPHQTHNLQSFRQPYDGKPIDNVRTCFMTNA
jgi:hypothetical protein